MKKQIITCIFLLFTASISAQEDVADYKRFDALAKKINDIQRTADGKKVKSDQADLILSIPPDNFFFNYHKQSATNINKVEDALLVYENLDLSDVNAIGILDESFGGCGMVAISTNRKQGYTVVANGKTENAELEDIAFYFSSTERAKGNEMFDALVELIYLTKIKKGLLTSEQAARQRNKWKQTVEKNTAAAYYDYWNNEPENLFTDLAYYKFEKNEKSLTIDKIQTGIYAVGMTKKQFEDFVYGQFKQVQSEDQTWKEVVENYKIPYFVNSKGLTEVATIYAFDIGKLTTGIKSKKLEKIKPITNPVSNKLKQVADQNDLLSLLPPGGKFRLGAIRFNQKDIITEVSFFYENEAKSAAEITSESVKKFGAKFGEPSYVDAEKTYFKYGSKYTKRSITLFSGSLVLITVSMKSTD
ncbi:hypothetical protein [Sphingobacterium sp. SYP-B4668]|uniref:hypothetical protein n=1 Tax=Sphingobacterium sp. SYP-B4668 TaxID=2996035 RepID=UPI0022DD7796|nr:hypothetical protein [Sphingobacterium sp. SYP-B4668]